MIDLKRKENRAWQCGVALGLGLLVCGVLEMLACSAASPVGLSPRDAWLSAPKLQGARWNREKELDRLVAGRNLAGKTRAEMVREFGEPGYSWLDYPGGSRIEEYRLSAKNDTAFRVDYDEDGKVHEDSIESSGCVCLLCKADAPAVPMGVVQGSGLLKKGDGYVPSGLTMAQVEGKLGSRGRVETSRNVMGGQVWFGYSETWRIGDRPGEWFEADGHVSWRNAPDDSVGKQPVESWSVMTFAPDCLAQ